MSKGLTVKQLIERLQKYPSTLVVSVYRPPFTTAYRVLADPKQWLYNTQRLYVPIKETKSITLPSSYKLPRKSRRGKKNEQ